MWDLVWKTNSKNRRARSWKIVDKDEESVPNRKEKVQSEKEREKKRDQDRKRKEGEKNKKKPVWRW